VTVVCLPLAHWVFDPSGWLASRPHLLDFAGGTAVEVNSGAAALALAVVLGRRLGWPRDQARPHNLPAVMLGAGILWFGWIAYPGGLTYALARILEKFVGLRAAPDDELAGIDEAEHAETGYDYGRVGAHLTTAAHANRAAPVPVPVPAGAARSGTDHGRASLEAC
jgi:ammonia channel protein AmtB